MISRGNKPSNQATIADYKKLPEGAPYELIGGRLVEEPSPEYGHQRTSMTLSSDIHQFVKKNKLGEILAAPMDVYLDEENVFQPDILFIASENSSIIQRDGIHGAPDLVIEIISPSNAYHDYAVKLHVYEKQGVKEYFIVDPETKEVVGYSLVEGKYKEQYRENGVVISKILKQQFQF